MSSTRLPNRRAAKAKIANEHVIDRLRHLKAQPIDPKILKAIVGTRALKAKEATEMIKQIQAMVADSERVKRTLHDLEQVPSLVQRGSVLL